MSIYLIKHFVLLEDSNYLRVPWYILPNLCFVLELYHCVSNGSWSLKSLESSIWTIFIFYSTSDSVRLDSSSFLNWWPDSTNLLPCFYFLSLEVIESNSFKFFFAFSLLLYSLINSNDKILINWESITITNGTTSFTKDMAKKNRKIPIVWNKFSSVSSFGGFQLKCNSEKYGARVFTTIVIVQ